MGLFNIFKKKKDTTPKKTKKHKEFKGYWNDDNGLALTDTVSTLMTIFIIVFIVWITREILVRPMGVDQLSALEFMIEKVMYLMSIILVGHYGNGIIKTGVSSVVDTFAKAKQPLQKVNELLESQQNSNTTTTTPSTEGRDDGGNTAG